MSNTDILMRPKQIRVERTEELLPDEKRTANYLSRLGYSVPEALADLVDNSIEADAGKILIRIIRSDDSILRVAIVDDGNGMDAAKLKEAMRFGGGDPFKVQKLGKYGIGLKFASLSQARTVTVLSKQKDCYVGRRWTIENIGNGWISEILSSDDVAKYMNAERYEPLDLRKKGTIVLWDDLEHLKTPPHLIDKTITRVIREITNELGLRFHRFLSPRKVHIFIDAQMASQKPTPIQYEIEALDPFSYPKTGREGYPKKFTILLPPHGKLSMECYIWPAKSREPGYRLGGGKVSARQGFYFYRNDRLIQAGGWNQCRDDDTEPHLSLARVRVDLPPSLDSAFKLDVKKSRVEPPPEFSPMVNNISESNGSFKEYTEHSQEVYRKHKTKEGALFKFLPGRGFPVQARAAAKRILWKEGTGKPRYIHYKWDDLDPDEFVRLDRDNNRLILNMMYRDQVLQNKRASGADAPLIKLMLLLLFQDEFDRRISSAKYKEWVEKVNYAIVAMLKREV